MSHRSTSHRSTVPLVADAAVVGIALLAASAAAVVGVIASEEVAWWVAALFIAASAIFARGALAVIAGLIAGRALMELRLAHLYPRWEHQHDGKLYGTTGRFRPILERIGFEEIYIGS